MPDIPDFLVNSGCKTTYEEKNESNPLGGDSTCQKLRHGGFKQEHFKVSILNI